LRKVDAPAMAETDFKREAAQFLIYPIGRDNKFVVFETSSTTTRTSEVLPKVKIDEPYGKMKVVLFDVIDRSSYMNVRGYYMKDSYSQTNSTNLDRTAIIQIGCMQTEFGGQILDNRGVSFEEASECA
jgi:hypothetical protein